ncbi:MAG: hypothetical protein Kow00120_08060 [Anaerolineae bacterium]
MPEEVQVPDEVQSAGNAPPDERELARRVAERVWQLWREELRRERERRGQGQRRR